MWLVFASLAAVSFGLRGVLYHWTSTKPMERSLMLCGVFFTGTLISLACALVLGEPWTFTALTGMMMGVFSFGANACMVKGFSVGKASLIAVLTALPPVVVVLLAFAIWGETLTSLQLVCFAVILSGILLIRFSGDVSFKHLEGVKWGLLTTLFFGLNDMAGKWSTMLDAATFPTLVGMFATGTVLFGLSYISGTAKRRRAAADNSRVIAEAAAQWSRGKTFGIGMAVGITNSIGMVFILQAFDLGVTGLVSAVVAMNVVVILLYTRIVVKEKFTRKELTGMILAICGIILLRLFE
ncbi:EamA family transporter [Paenibacillus sambharensis]|uniref:EamA family transporter n=1 Tax=Paenibacillus sambharensis TaxID=1803190 RepID=A0A2W1L5B7_9BACL|nr:EamA family transporter [Paenibacillus sambharensis]PZD94123.1 EamA family transporter [Paenibacillus sambharensis]